MAEERPERRVAHGAARREHGQGELPYPLQPFVRERLPLAQRRDQPGVRAARGIGVRAGPAGGFGRLRAWRAWRAEAPGADRVRAMADGLRAMVSPGALRLDARRWFGG
ncbi:hypothetical protein ACFVWY_25580 [Streptomyces sp. NPDC058195]|uniref:hypothetical protein n=1 Tax=Streptomyces sp. NPDC058195 TaxID=3346375 RepID=UPI0036E3B971